MHKGFLDYISTKLFMFAIVEIILNSHVKKNPKNPHKYN